MLRTFYSDFRNYLKSTGFKIGVIVIFGYVTFFSAVMALLYRIALHDIVPAEDVLCSYCDMAAFLITGSTLLMFATDYSNGTIRNKILSGAKRSEIYLSAIFTGILISLIYSAIAIVFELGFALVLSNGLAILTVSEEAGICLQYMISSMAIGAFSTMLVMVLGGLRISYFAGLVFAFVCNIISSEVADKLYPQEGPVMITGARLFLYTAYDRFMPYAHFQQFQRWPFSSYVIGSAVMIAISILVGLIIFERKEIR